MGKGSGSVTTFSRADGFVVIPRQQEYLEAGDARRGQPARPGAAAGRPRRDRQPLRRARLPARPAARPRACAASPSRSAAPAGWRRPGAASATSPASTCSTRRPTPTTARSSTPDLELSPATAGCRARLPPAATRASRAQSWPRRVAAALADPDCVLVNRNRGSGTRILIDRLLGGARPPGYPTEARSHNAVVAAVAQGRADWGVAIETVAAARPASASCRCRRKHTISSSPIARLGRPAVRGLSPRLPKRTRPTRRAGGPWLREVSRRARKCGSFCVNCRL